MAIFSARTFIVLVTLFIIINLVARGNAVAAADTGTPSEPVKSVEETVVPETNGNVPEDGHFTSWTDWSACDKECNGGNRSRTREYIPAVNGGVNLSLDEKAKLLEKELCNPQPCPENGKWGEWTAWTACDKSCGAGTQSRTRVYTPAVNGGVDLEDKNNNIESGECNTDSCESHTVIFTANSYNQTGKNVYSPNGIYRFLWQGKQHIYLQKKDDNWNWNNIASIHALRYSGWGELNLITGRFHLENYGPDPDYSIIAATNILTAGIAISNNGEVFFVDSSGKNIGTILKRGDDKQIT